MGNGVRDKSVFWVLLFGAVLLFSGCEQPGSPASQEEPSGTDAALQSLELSAGYMDPPFDPAITAYAAVVGNAVDSITLTGVPRSSAATVAGDNGSATPLAEGENPPIRVAVTAGDGVLQKTYTVTVTRLGPSLISVNSAGDLAKIGKDPAWPLAGNYKLAADITLENWTPIGPSGDRAFSGSFDGDGKTIRIKSFNAGFMGANDSLGVFAYVRGSAAAKARIGNLKVHSELEHALSNRINYFVGAVTGQGLPYSLYDSITVTGSLAFSNNARVSAGGVAGALNGGEARGCVVNASVTVHGSGGGGTYSYAGGVAGKFEGGAFITDCHSAGNVSGSTDGANVIVGGIAGGTLHPWTGGDSRAFHGKIEGCSSSGTISASGAYWWPIAGGIAGHINGDGSKTPGAGRTRVYECWATGTVQAEGPAGSWPYVGGIVGQNQSAGLVSRCYFDGTLRSLGDSINDYTGGIAGYNTNDGIVEDCRSSGTINGRINGGGIVGQNQRDSALRRSYSTAAITLRGLAGERGSAAGDGAGGIAGYNQSVLEDALSSCVALNPSITTAGYERVHRIVGAVSGNEFSEDAGVQTNNRAWEGMTISVGGVPVSPDDIGINGMDGQGTTEKPDRGVYVALGWDFTAVWEMGGDGYPHLQWEE